jgi:hypothetical protein
MFAGEHSVEAIERVFLPITAILSCPDQPSSGVDSLPDTCVSIFRVSTEVGQLHYDEKGNLTKETDPFGAVTTYSYDEWVRST